MTKRNEFTEEIIEGLCKEQKISEIELYKIRMENDELPDGILLGFLLGYFVDRPEVTNWKVMLNELERILAKSQNEEQIRSIYQDILESLSNLVANKELDPKWLLPYLGPQCRDYLNEYEKWVGSSFKY